MKTRALAPLERRRWNVVRVNNDGRSEVAHARLTGEAAQLIAGAMRDEMTDAEVAEGWNYEPKRAA